jgi:Flp pilus assembly protein TadG
VTQRNVKAVANAGQALVEFSLTFSLCVFLLFILIDGGRAVFAYSTLANASREGVRVAIVNQNLAGIQNEVIGSAVSLGLSTSNVDYVGYKQPGDASLGTNQPQSAVDCSPVAPGCIAVVKVHYQFNPITPIVGNFIGSVTFSTSTEMPIERAYINP